MDAHPNAMPSKRSLFGKFVPQLCKERHVGHRPSDLLLPVLNLFQLYHSFLPLIAHSMLKAPLFLQP
jgi:hypothetical protein